MVPAHVCIEDPCNCVSFLISSAGPSRNLQNPKHLGFNPNIWTQASKFNAAAQVWTWSVLQHLPHLAGAWPEHETKTAAFERFRTRLINKNARERFRIRFKRFWNIIIDSGRRFSNTEHGARPGPNKFDHGARVPTELFRTRR